MKNRDTLAVFNRGRISRLAVARTDVSRISLSAAIQTNWVPRTLGPMSLRPGLEFIGETVENKDAIYIPFVYSNDDCALLEMTSNSMRIFDDGTDLVSVETVGAVILNENFGTSLAGWVDADDAGAVSSWSSSQAMSLLGTKYAAARRRQTITPSVGEENTVHTINIVIARGPVLLRIGAAVGDDDIFRQAVLRTGYHSISFVPGGNFSIEFSSSLNYETLVHSCKIGIPGVLQVTTPWSYDECRSIRYAQSYDVLFVASEAEKPWRIERRPNNSWSVVEYEANDGPFNTQNTSNLTITPSAITGDITLTASRPVFDVDHIDTIFSLSSQGQRVESDLSAELTYTNEIRVTGVGDQRKFQVSRAGTWSGTVTLQRSLGEPGAWVDVKTYTTNATVTHDDGLDNSIAYYRIGFNAGGYTSGTAEVSLEFEGGSITGIVRVTGYISSTLVNAVVLSDLGADAATEIWAEGAWSDVNGWPDAVVINEGRLIWFGQGRTYASVSDSFTSFDPDYEGDAGPINRSIGSGAVNSTSWALALGRLLVGVDGGVHSIRSNSFDEPITASNYNSKPVSTAGTSDLPAVASDGSGYFVDRSEKRMFELQPSDTSAGFSKPFDLTLLVPEIGEAGFYRMAFEESPDRRLHAVRGDGTVGLMVRDSAEDVLAWIDIETDGVVRDVAVLPGVGGDRVFYLVKRTIGGVDHYYHEQMASHSECVGDYVNKLADSLVVGSGAITGIDHLEGEEVVIWGDGVDQGTATVSGGAISQSYDTWVVGLGYTATYKSAKLAGQTALGLSLTQRSRIDHLGLLLADTHAFGLQYGPDLDTLDDMPMIEDGVQVDADSVWEDYDEDMIEFPGDWSTDNRICLRAAAPRPCTVLAVVASIDRQDKA